MKRPHRDEDGTYTVKGRKYNELFGSREQVMNGTAYKTTGGLIISQLTMNKWGRIVSTLKHKTAKSEKRLEKHGYYAKKGKFGYVKKTARKSRSNRKIKGGNVNLVVPAKIETHLATGVAQPNPAQLQASGVSSTPPLPQPLTQ